MTDPIDVLEKLLEDSSVDHYETLVNAGLALADDLDGRKWTLGDLSCLVDKAYGQNMLRQFADRINIEAARLAEYRTVARYYPRQNPARAELLSRGVRYTHFRDAMRLKDVNDSVQFLHEAADNGWKVEAARVELAKRAGKSIPPARYLDAVTRIVAVRRNGNIGVVTLEMDAFLLDALAAGLVTRTIMQEAL